jgi:gliding motility-associated-like protein
MRIFTSFGVIAFLLLFCFSPSSHAQTYIMGSQALVTTCNGVFTDSGDNSAGYQPNEDLTMTFCPDGGSGQNIQLVFSGVNIIAGDELCFYDGDDATADQIVCYEAFMGASSFIVQATAANASGCLTVVFISDASGQGNGWSADINCIQDCQTIFAELASTIPEVSPADTGWIDICPGDRVTLSGQGVYPQDGVAYDQSDLTSTFTWDFGDGNSALGPNVSHVYEEPGGYIVQLTIADEQECTNINYISQRIRVATYPQFTAGGNLPDELCAGDTISLDATVGSQNGGSVVSVESTPGGFQAGGIVSDSLPLPDGVGVPYSTSINFTDFSPGQTLTDISDLLGVCVIMEHSWMYDLDIYLECPNGTQIIMQNQEFIGNEVHLGTPFEADDANTPSPPAQGIGAEYCWTPGSTNGTWTEYAQSNDPGGFGEYVLPEGDYQTFDPMTDLIGCPLNGEWTIEVWDQWGSDNGWIFEWSILFNEDLYPSLETYQPQIIDFQWEQIPSVISYSADSLAVEAAPVLGGEALYTFTVEDDFGCVFDTSITIDVLPFAHPDCYDCQESFAPLLDTIVCEGETVSFNAASSTPPSTASGFITNPQQEFGASTNPPSNPLYLPLDISFINPGIITDPLTQIESVCIDILTDWNDDLNIFLEAPSGAQLELTTGNGGGSDNYLQTCFSPAATTPITDGNGPFTGTFMPEGDWSVLAGEVINGQWNLVVTDAFGFNDLGEVLSWSITFNSINEPSYSWSGVGLSCTNCPDPDVTPLTSQDYIVSSLDNYGCSYMDTVSVIVVNEIEAPEVDCISSEEGSIIFSWLPVGNFTEYEIRVINNGVPGPWQGPVTDLAYTENNLSFGDEITLEVRVYVGGSPLDCTILIDSSTCNYDGCALSANLSSAPADVSCNGNADGSAAIVAMGGDMPYTYYIVNDSVPQANGNFTGLSAGNYAVVVTDGLGCVDTVNFIINEPDSLVVDIQVDQPIACYDGNMGMLTAAASGGTPGYTYEWNTSPVENSATISNLFADSYTVTVTDDESCTATATYDLMQPDSISISFNIVDSSCPSEADGAIQATVSGGTAPLNLNWSNNGTGNEQSNLLPGTYCLTVTDDNACEKVACVDVGSPNALMVDAVITNAVLCNGGNTGTATVLVSGGNEPYTFLWNDPLAQTAQQANMLSAANYTVIITDDNDCEISTEVIIEEPDVLELSFTTEEVLCNGGAEGSATAVVTGGTMPYSYAWGDGQNDETALNLPADDYSVTITDANDCMVEGSISVTEPATPVSLSIEQIQMGCYGLSQNQLLVTAEGGTGPNYTYQWSNGQTQATATGLDTISYTVSVFDENGCEVSAFYTPEDLEPIDFLIIDTPPNCNGYADGRLGINQVSGGNGLEVEDYIINWSSGATGPTADNLLGGVTYSVTVTDSQGCEESKERFLEEPIAISFNLDVVDALCFGNQDGSITVTNIIGENDNYTFNWSNGQASATASGLAAGAYSVTVTDEDGCFNISTEEIEQPEELSIEYQTEDTPCFGTQGGSILAMVSGGVPTYSYNWSNGATQNNLEALGAGTYELVVTDLNGCTSTISATVEQPEPIQAAFEATDPSCFGASDGSISITASGGSIPYRYSIDGDFYVGSSMLIALEADDYQVSILDGNGCTFTDRVSLSNPPEFSVDAGSDSYTITLGDSIDLYANAENASGLVDFEWQAPYDGTLSCTFCEVTTSLPQVSILYFLYGIDENGCEDTDMVHVYVDKPRVVAVPTGFTPNGDNNNDKLIVHGRRGTMVQYFQVFDRWGELLYEARDFEVNDSNYGWDGTFKGDEVNPGVYIWQLVVTYEDGMEEAYYGETTLIR